MIIRHTTNHWILLRSTLEFRGFSAPVFSVTRTYVPHDLSFKQNRQNQNIGLRFTSKHMFRKTYVSKPMKCLAYKPVTITKKCANETINQNKECQYIYGIKKLRLFPTQSIQFYTVYLSIRCCPKYFRYFSQPIAETFIIWTITINTHTNQNTKSRINICVWQWHIIPLTDFRVVLDIISTNLYIMIEEFRWVCRIKTKKKKNGIGN